MIKKLCLIVVVISSCSAPTFAQPQDTRDRIETRTYDVSDLLRATANYPLVPQAARGPAQPVPEAVAGALKSPVNSDELAVLIQDTVDRESWRDNGGTIGAMRTLGNVMVITQSVAAHDQVRNLLDQLRGDPALATMLSVRGYWVKLDPTEVAGVYAAAKPLPNSNFTPMPELPDKFLDKDHLYFMGQTTCFNSQTVHISAGREFSYISDLTPVVAQGAVAFDPTVSKIQSGVQLQVTPQIMPSGDMASVDLHSTVTETSPAGPIPLESPTTRLSVSPPPGMAVERLNAVTQQFHTTVRVPLRKKLLIGGMTLEPASKDNTPRQLYLVVEVDAVR